MGEFSWFKCIGMLGWFKWLGMLGWLELACPTTWACLFKVRLGVLSKTLSHMWGKLNLSIFLFKVGLLALINIDSLIFLAKGCPFLPIIWKFCWVFDLCYCYDDVWGITPSGALWIFHQRSWKFPLGIHYHRWGHHTGTSVWPHFCWPWGLCPWGRPEGFWWCYYLWSGFVCHTSNRSF